MKNDELLHKWVNGSLSEEELALFKKRPEYDSLDALYKNTEKLSPPDFKEEEMLSDILKKGKRIALPFWIRYAAAASVLLLAGWFFWPSANTLVAYQSAKGEQKKGLLPDQSTFVLNAESILTYDSKAWTGKRQLDLEGEAFFKVKKGARFRVHTANGSVQVLGTAFNVRSRKDQLEVRCESGKVAVFSAEGQLLNELQPNEALRIDGGKLTEKWNLEAGDQLFWTKGISRFRKVPLAKVLEELERQFDIQIDAQAITTTDIITCNFPHGNLELALKSTLTPLGIKYKMKEGRVSLYLNKKE